MLQFLRIENLALMDGVSLEFDEGFTAVTGETGAGKSVLLGALSLLAGNRAEKTIIRKGADETRVEAVLQFDPQSAIHQRLEQTGLPACDDEGALVLRRVVSRKRASRVEINGSVATLGQLQQLGEAWIDFHGPGEPQKLFREAYQLEMLDRFAGNEGALAAYAEGFREWKELLERADALETGERLSADEVAFLRAQVEKIDALEMPADALEELERDFNRLHSAREITGFAGQLAEGLTGDEGLAGRGAELLRVARELAELDSTAEGLAGRLNSVLLELEDLGVEYGQLAEAGEMDEETARNVNERMTAWLEVNRRYGPGLPKVKAARDAMVEKVESQGDIEGTIAQLRSEADKREKTLRTGAEKLTKEREKAAKKLAKKATGLLPRLGFKKAELQIDVVRGHELTACGDSHCVFLFRANAGQDLLPLNKIASSGETARVMLALKTVLAEVDETPVLVFDEVDANVGGEIGSEVGKELARLAGGHQVFCVTHLPQVAARAARHFVVEKAQSDKSTSVSIKPIHAEDDARLDELARMLGDRKSRSAREHAAELLAQ